MRAMAKLGLAQPPRSHGEEIADAIHHEARKGKKMAYGIATYRGEEIDVDFSAAGERVDYGVPRSPRWTEWTNPKIEEVTILGVTLTPDEERALPPRLRDALLKLADEVEFETSD